MFMMLLQARLYQFLPPPLSLSLSYKVSDFFYFNDPFFISTVIVVSQ